MVRSQQSEPRPRIRRCEWSPAMFGPLTCLIRFTSGSYLLVI